MSQRAFLSTHIRSGRLMEQSASWFVGPLNGRFSYHHVNLCDGVPCHWTTAQLDLIDFACIPIPVSLTAGNDYVNRVCQQP